MSLKDLYAALLENKKVIYKGDVNTSVQYDPVVPNTRLMVYFLLTGQAFLLIESELKNCSVKVK